MGKNGKLLNLNSDSPKYGNKSLVTKEQENELKRRKITFSFSYFKQIPNFQIGECSKGWHIGLLERLGALGTMTPQEVLEENRGSIALRCHPIDWSAKNIPIQRKDLDWLPKEILDNETDFPIMQFSITKSTGRIVGYFDRDSSIFHIVLLDPEHNIQPAKKTNCLERTTPDCIKRLTGICPKPLEIMVEDNLAEALVRKILRTHNLEQSCKVSQFGSKENSYLVGAGLLLRGETLDNTLIVLDGDVDVAEAEKRTKINRVITGTDNDSQQRRDKLLSKIKQFCLPVNRKPEEFITDELKTLDDAVHSLIPHIKATGPVQDHHDLLNTPITNSGMPEQTAFAEIVTLMEHRPCWANYVAEIDDWVVDKKQN